jgi:hypothetical protein
MVVAVGADRCRDMIELREITLGENLDVDKCPGDPTLRACFPDSPAMPHGNVQLLSRPIRLSRRVERMEHRDRRC